MAADIVDLARRAGVDNASDAARVILNIKPVADIAAVAVNRNLATVQYARQAQRNQLFREVIRAIVIGAIAGRYLQAVCVLIRSHQVIAAGLARRVGRIGLITRGFGKRRIVCREGAVHFVGGYMVKTMVTSRP